jgi:long-subunit acyl-CoA synthetase (AMP-forming)
MTEHGVPSTLCEAFQETVAKYPLEVALRTPGGAETFKWREYADRVREIAAGLAGLGVGHGDTVALMMTNRLEFHLMDTAVFHLGAIPFSIYNTLAPGQIRQVLSNAASRVMVCEEQFAAPLLAVRDGTAVEHVVCVDGNLGGMVTLEDLVAGGDPAFGFEACWRAVRPDDVLTLIYTSGTTGPPKGVEITHAQMLAELTATNTLMPTGIGDRAISYLPMAHVAQRFGTHYTGMFTGMQATAVADPRDLPGALLDVRPTFFAAVPRVWEKLKAGIELLVAHEPDQAKRQAMQQAVETGHQYVRATQADHVPAELAEAYRRADEQVLSKIRAALGLDQVRIAVSGAAPIAPKVLEFMLALGIQVAEVWGMSEASCIGTANPPDAIRIGTVGKAIPGIELKLAADGELLMRGPTVMKGYHKEPGKTAEAIDPAGWLHTGDIATIDDDGYVRIVDRKKDLIINAAGKNMSPANIEAAILAASPLIAQVVAIGDRRPHVVTLIVLDPETAAAFAVHHGATATSAAALAAHPAIRAAIETAVNTGNSKLSRVEQVKRFTILPAFWEPGGEEITPTMKLKRRPIAAKYAELIDSMYATAAQPA